MPLSDFCRDCTEDGFCDVRNYLSTGNILLRASSSPATVARRIEALIARYGLQNRAFVRRPVELRRILATDPFPDASRDRPSRVLVAFYDHPLSADGVESLRARAGPERVHGHGRELYVDFAEGIGTSKLTPAVMDRTLGQVGTARNWNTVRGILERL